MRSEGRVVDLSGAYSKPLAREVLEAADRVVTMGRSVGSVEIPEATRHADIDDRVQALLAELEGSAEAPEPA
jgi:hypothetical protein